MKLSLLGLSHKTAPVHIREQFAFDADVLPRALQDLQKLGASEAVIVSTCNRVEIAVTSPESLQPREIVDGFLALVEGVGFPVRPASLPA